jgi:hypothetical protein
MRPDGTCPADHQVAEPGQNGEGDAATRVPWHFWLLVVALVIYLGWRLVQGIEWLL